MRYERLNNIIQLATLLQVRRGGLTLDDVMREFNVSRRTAERLRDVVEAAFGPLMTLDAEDRRVHWRLDSRNLGGLIRVSDEELANLATAAASLDRSGLAEQAASLQALADKLKAKARSGSPQDAGAGTEELLRAEGLAMRPGPRQQLEDGLLSTVREAIRRRRVLTFDYAARGPGAPNKRRRVRPYGVLYGNRALLVAPTERHDDVLLWRLSSVRGAKVTDAAFMPDAGFDLTAFAKRAFGVFQERPFNVTLRFTPNAAPDAAAFLFHPDQQVERHDDGSLRVRFRAGGALEMCWHLCTWGEEVAIERPDRLRKQMTDLCAALAAHHAR
ncbi:MAG: WYL domain-containing protein [Gammaproteobacteria bacterium]|nr:WYL domain-containing protein [Gammaproteobacteria bacterium]